MTFVPLHFAVPRCAKILDWQLEPLGPHHLAEDFEAVMSSKERLRRVFQKNDDWPADDMTVEQDLSDLEWHFREFDSRNSFAFAMRHSESREYAGCLYLIPSTKFGFEVEAYFWFRDDVVNRDKGLDERFLENLSIWLGKNWPFRRVAFPGRIHSWHEWCLLESNGNVHRILAQASGELD